MKTLSSTLTPLLAALLLMSTASMLAAGERVGTATLELADMATGRKVTTELWFEAAGEPKRLVVIPGGDHNDPPSRPFYAALDEFLSGLDGAGSR